MFNKDFNPYEELQEIRRACEITSRQVSQLAKNLSQQATLAQQMVTQINSLTEAINQQSLQLEDLHNRMRLIEVARQYDDQYKNQN